MDDTERKMTKIAREVSKFTVQTMKEDGIGTAEFDVIYLVRHNPGITDKSKRNSENRQRSRSQSALSVTLQKTLGHQLCHL